MGLKDDLIQMWNNKDLSLRFLIFLRQRSVLDFEQTNLQAIACSSS